jgi:hypothetical protein
MQWQPDDERGYSWFFLNISRPWKISFLVTVAIIVVSVIFYVWYGNVFGDKHGDSVAGLIFAVAGTLFMILASVGFTLRRQARKRYVGQLNALLNWHIAFGILALVMIFLHAYGNFNPRSGTYALYAMIALVIAGIIGRCLDRMVPRMITDEVSKALTAQGEDRIESISRKLQSIVVHNKQELRGFQKTPGPLSMPGTPAGRKGAAGGPAVLQSSWDMAYISLDETPQELSRDNSQYRFVPDRRSNLTRPGALYPGAEEHMSAIAEVQQALKKEEFLRYVIRFWRVVHIALVVLTVGLTLWHLEFAFSLIIPAVQKFGIGYLFTH